MKLNVAGETMSSLICCRETKISRSSFHLNLMDNQSKRYNIKETVNQDND